MTRRALLTLAGAAVAIPAVAFAAAFIHPRLERLPSPVPLEAVGGDKEVRSGGRLSQPAHRTSAAHVEYKQAGEGRVVASHTRQPFWFKAVLLHPDGRWVISDEVVLGADPRRQAPFRTTRPGSRVVLRQAETLSPIRELQNVARPLAVSPDGERLLALDREGWVGLWETRGWTRTRRLTPGSIESPAGVFSRTGDIVGVVERGERVGLWQLRTGRRVAIVEAARELFGFPGSGAACLASSGRGWGTTVYLADAASGKILRDVGREFDAVGYAWRHALSGDGALLATSGRDDELLIWNADTWSVTHRVRLPREGTNELAWSPDGSALIVRDESGVIAHVDAATGVRTQIYRCAKPYGRVAADRQGRLVVVTDGPRLVALRRRR
jgi:WD40 repeat protein